MNYSEEIKEKSTTDMEVRTPGELAPLVVTAGPPIPGPDRVNVARSLSTERRIESRVTGVGKGVFAIECRVLTKRLLSFSGKVDVRPGCVRGDRVLGHVEASMTTPEPEEQLSEMIADYLTIPYRKLWTKLKPMSIVSHWTSDWLDAPMWALESIYFQCKHS